MRRAVATSVPVGDLPLERRPQAARDAGSTAVESWWPVESVPPAGREVEWRDAVAATVGIGERLGARLCNALYGNRVDGAVPAAQDALAVVDRVAVETYRGAGEPRGRHRGRSTGGGRPGDEFGSLARAPDVEDLSDGRSAAITVGCRRTPPIPPSARRKRPPSARAPSGSSTPS